MKLTIETEDNKNYSKFNLKVLMKDFCFLHFR